MIQCLTKYFCKKTLLCQLFDTLPQAREARTSHVNTFPRLVCAVLLTFSTSINSAVASDDVFPFKSCFEASGKKYEISPSLLAAVASVESSFNPLAESSSGALGLMQIKWPVTAKELGITNKSDLFEPCKNIDAGANYLSYLSSRFGSKLLAIAAYFQGPTRIGEKNNIPKKSVGYVERVLREEALIASSNELKRDGKCELVTFQALTQNTHHPKKRLEVTYRWIVEHRQFCSTPDLLRIRNRLPELMGTADAKGELRLLIENTIRGK
jgi:hypothetical protein